MKKLTIFVLCLVWLIGCVPVPVGPSQAAEVTQAPAAPVRHETPAPSAVPETKPPKEATALPATAAPKATATPKAKATAKSTATPKSTPKPTPKSTPKPTATPRPTAVPDQTYTGTYFKFTAPGSWMKAKTADGVYFYPDVDDTRHTYFLYQETANDMNLTETKLDIALMFSSKESVTAMVEGALTGSGMTNFKLSPVTVQKTKLNGLTCYKGASDITQAGETYDFVGHIFLRGDKMVLFIWVGDQVKYAAGLKKVYDSIEAVK